jgi:hypothetical protein
MLFTNRIGLVLVAIVAGSLVPVGAAAYLATRDPLPSSCRSGQPTASTKAGTMVLADGPSLSLVQGDTANPTKVIDYAAANASTLAAKSPAPSPSPAAAPPPSPSPSPSPSATSRGVAAQFLAAAISSDHRTLATVVSDPPDSPGKLSVRVIDPTLPPPTAPHEAWSGPKAGASGRSEIRFLPNGDILFFVPQRFDPPEKATRLVGVIALSTTPKLAQSAPEDLFVTSLHSAWPETADYKLPDDRPQLQDRVLGPGDQVAGRLDHRFRSPLVDRTVHEVTTGHLGQGGTKAVCAVLDDLTPTAFSPDGRTLAVADGSSSYLLDPAGGHGVVFLLRGRVLDWRG